MADEAHKEPTMEEILSSIRKIISEDEKPSEEPDAEVAAATFPVDEPDNDDFEDLTFSDISSNDVADDEFGDELEEDIFEASETYETEDAFDNGDFDVDDISAPEEAPVETFAAPEEETFEPEPTIAEAPYEAQPEPEPVLAQEEPTMPAAARIDTGSLTDSATADAAAGALGQLFSKVNLSSENTLEGVVRELLKPMIKEWLDANLQGIVEAKVEAEVARIARMAG